MTMTLATKGTTAATFPAINTAYNTVFTPGRLSVGLVVPIESYPSSAVPTMTHHIERVQLAEALGFAAVWLRDVPFNVPAFGDAGQTYDPFVYLGALAVTTRCIALGVASVILPLRHPAHVAKAAATADVLSDGRLILGVASGDRPDEYPALGVAFEHGGARFRDSYDYIRRMSESRPRVDSPLGHVANDLDLLPKPVAGRLPLLVTGASQQSPEWLANHGDGWMTYPRPTAVQARLIAEYRARIEAADGIDKPIMEPLYIDLVDEREAVAQPIHLGLRLGTDALRDYLETRASIGVNHVALNLRFNRAETESTLKKLAQDILPYFTTKE